MNNASFYQNQTGEKLMKRKKTRGDIGTAQSN